MGSTNGNDDGHDNDVSSIGVPGKHRLSLCGFTAFQFPQQTKNGSQTGIDFESWTETEGLVVEDGAVFWTESAKAPSKWPCIVAQVTVPSGTPWSATVNARGKIGPGKGPTMSYESATILSVQFLSTHRISWVFSGGGDWEATNLVFSDAKVPAWEGGGEGQDESGHRRRGLQGSGGDGTTGTVSTGTGCDALVVSGGTVMYSPCFTGSPGCR